MVNSKNYIIGFILFLTLLYCDNVDKTIDVITTNDIHGMLVSQKAEFFNPNFPPTIIGASGLNKYLNDFKIHYSLIFDGGNFFQGHPIGIVDSGKTVIEWMNRLGYNALVPGKDDFIFGYKNLINLSKKASFPFLASNLVYNDSKKTVFDPYIIIEKDNIRVGVLGIIPANLDEFVLGKNIENLSVITEIKSLEKWVPIIKEENVDIIILLSSLGVPWDREQIYNNFENKYLEVINDNEYKCNNSIELSYFTKDIEIIISGGENKGYNLPLYNGYTHSYVFQNYGNFTEFGHFKLNFDTKNKFLGYNSVVSNKIAQTLYIDDFEYDEEVYEWISKKNDEAIKQVYDVLDFSDITGDSDGIIYEDVEGKNFWDIPSYNQKDKNTIVTWNCEFFPAANDSTILALSEIVDDMNVDIIAFQEIRKIGWFDKLMKKLPAYDFVISKQSSFMHHAIIFKKDIYKLQNSMEIFAENDYNFAGRPPLRCDLINQINNIKISIINLHMKCCDSGLNRRKKASEMLYKYLDKEVTDLNTNFIVLGDWNDDLKDKEDEHCFNSFLNDTRFFFPTYKITFDIEQASYPKEPYVSFLDHILVTKSILNSDKFHVETIRLDELMGSFEIYETYISDHFPVLLSF